jgi:uncharacterized low-complexity protein
MKKLIKLGLIIVGATALTFTLASATGDEAPETMKCQAGKCDSGKNMKCGGSKDINKTGTKCNGGEDMKKSVPEKGKCGTGKCG